MKDKEMRNTPVVESWATSSQKQPNSSEDVILLAHLSSSPLHPGPGDSVLW